MLFFLVLGFFLNTFHFWEILEFIFSGKIN